MKLHTRWLLAVMACLLALGVPVTRAAQVPTAGKVPPMQVLLDGALKTAKAENKVVLVHFSASWCKWCKYLDAALTGPELAKIVAQDYVLMSLTVLESDDKKALENPGAEDLMTQMKGEGLPFLLFFDKDGNKLADSMVMPGHGNIGYPVTSDEIKAFEGLLKQTAPRMNSDQRAMFIDYLKQKAKLIESGAAPE